MQMPILMHGLGWTFPPPLVKQSNLQQQQHDVGVTGWHVT